MISLVCLALYLHSCLRHSCKYRPNRLSLVSISNELLADNIFWQEFKLAVSHVGWCVWWEYKLPITVQGFNFSAKILFKKGGGGRFGSLQSSQDIIDQTGTCQSHISCYASLSVSSGGWQGQVLQILPTR